MSQIEHILKRPDSYIGSVESLTQEMWVFNTETKRMQFRFVFTSNFTPCLTSDNPVYTGTSLTFLVSSKFSMKSWSMLLIIRSVTFYPSI